MAHKKSYYILYYFRNRFEAIEKNGKLTKHVILNFEMASMYGTFAVSRSCISIHYHLVATCLAWVWGESTWADTLAPARDSDEEPFWERRLIKTTNSTFLQNIYHNFRQISSLQLQAKKTKLKEAETCSGSSAAPAIVQKEKKTSKDRRDRIFADGKAAGIEEGTKLCIAQGDTRNRGGQGISSTRNRRPQSYKWGIT